MKIYCKDCLRKNDTKAKTCKKCGNELSKKLNDDEIPSFLQRLHKKTNDVRHYMSHALSFLVIGGILLVIAFFFYYLAFGQSIDPSTKEKIYVLNTACSEFWVSMVALIAGGTFFLGGLVTALFLYRQKRQILSDIDHVRENGDLNVPTVSLLIVVWAKAICKGFRHLIWLMKYKASEKKAKKEAK